MNHSYARRFFAGVAVATSRKSNDADGDSDKNRVRLITNCCTSEGYRQLMAVTKNIVAVKIEAETQDYVERLRIQREEGQYAMHKQTQASNIGAFQVEKQAEVGGANDFESTDSPNMWGISRWEKSVRFMMWK